MPFSLAPDVLAMAQMAAYFKGEHAAGLWGGGGGGGGGARGGRGELHRVLAAFAQVCVVQRVPAGQGTSAGTVPVLAAGAPGRFPTGLPPEVPAGGQLRSVGIGVP